MVSIEQAKLELVAEFPEGYFLENLAARADGSVLVSAMNKSELWYVPAPADTLPVQPVLIHTFDLTLWNRTKRMSSTSQRRTSTFGFRTDPSMT